MLLLGREQRDEGMRVVDLRHPVLPIVPRHGVELRVLAKVDGRPGPILLHVRRVHRRGDAGQPCRQIRSKDNILRVGDRATRSRSVSRVRQQLPPVPRVQVLVRDLRLGGRVHNRIRAQHGAGGRHEEDRLRDNVPTNFRRWFHAGCDLGGRDQGSYVAADRLRPSQRPVGRPLVADGRVAQVVVGPGPRHRGARDRAEGSEDERGRRRRGRRETDRGGEDSRARGSKGAVLRGVGLVQDAQSAQEDVERVPELVRQLDRLLRPVFERGQPGRQSLPHAVPQRPGRDAHLRDDLFPDGSAGEKVHDHLVHVDRRRVLHNSLRDTRRIGFDKDGDRRDRSVRQVEHIGLVRRYLQLHGRVVPHRGEEHGFGNWIDVRPSQRHFDTRHNAVGLVGPQSARHSLRFHRPSVRFPVHVSARDGEPTDARDHRGRGEFRQARHLLRHVLRLG